MKNVNVKSIIMALVVLVVSFVTGYGIGVLIGKHKNNTQYLPYQEEDDEIKEDE